MALQDMNGLVCFYIKAPASWLQELDVWRKAQTVPPTRAEAIRYLVELGLKYEAACKRLSKESEE